MRWFTSRDYATKALAFLPASTLADMMLRVMIALHPEEFAQELQQLNVPIVGALPAHSRLVCQVHDSLVLTGPPEEREEALYIVERVMTQPWPPLQGFALDVDSGWSFDSWGECK